jgi:hypothetical protein
MKTYVVLSPYDHDHAPQIRHAVRIVRWLDERQDRNATRRGGSDERARHRGSGDIP